MAKRTDWEKNTVKLMKALHKRLESVLTTDYRDPETVKLVAQLESTLKHGTIARVAVDRERYK